ncbi:MAG TPA: class I tRNA ligase family protein, partial [Methanocella sp.]|nr:class I tRNA ligase family protein [Methanocella sp.]
KVTFESVRDHLRVEDRWILSRLQAIIKEVNDGMANYELHRSTRALTGFILEDLSRWYVQLARERTWVEADDPDKLAAYRVLYDVLSTTVKLMAPYTPYVAERMYQNLMRPGEGPETVHMCDWPAVNEGLLDERLNRDMDVARRVVEAASNARQKAKRKLRWPVKKVTVVPDTEETATAVRDLENVIKEQTNAKEVVLLKVGEPNPELGVEVVPNPKVIGPAFKGDAGRVIDALKSADGRVVKAAIERKGENVLTLPGGEALITPDMVGFREVIPENLAMGEFPGGRLYVDVELTPGLEAEGYTRELIRRIQDMRKDLKLNVEDKIKTEVYVGDDRVRGLVGSLRDLIVNEVRAASLDLKADRNVSGALVKDWDVEGVPMTIGIQKA